MSKRARDYREAYEAKHYPNAGRLQTGEKSGMTPTSHHRSLRNKTR